MPTPQQPRSEREQAQSIADIVRERRLELGLSRAELARYVAPNCQPRDIDLLESNRTLMPSWIRLRQLAEALEVEVDELLPSSDGQAPHGGDPVVQEANSSNS